MCVCHLSIDGIELAWSSVTSREEELSLFARKDSLVDYFVMSLTEVYGSWQRAGFPLVYFEGNTSLF